MLNLGKFCPQWIGGVEEHSTLTTDMLNLEKKSTPVQGQWKLFIFSIIISTSTIVINSHRCQVRWHIQFHREASSQCHTGLLWPGGCNHPRPTLEYWTSWIFFSAAEQVIAVTVRSLNKPKSAMRLQMCTKKPIFTLSHHHPQQHLPSP